MTKQINNEKQTNIFECGAEEKSKVAYRNDSYQGMGDSKLKDEEAICNNKTSKRKLEKKLDPYCIPDEMEEMDR